MLHFSWKAVFSLTLLSLGVLMSGTGQQKHIYLANDNHTDYFWTANAEEYKGVALREIDYYLDLADATANLPASFQSRYNLDGAWYALEYQRNKSPEAFDRLISRIKDGHFSLPYNYLVSTYGGQPTEAVLRGMYWAGRLERQYGLDLSLVVSMENQTQPLGLASLWAGAGARYSWKGVCGCSSPVPNDRLSRRNHEIYHYRGLDGAGVLMKWYSLSPQGNKRLGGYAEARDPLEAITESEEKIGTPTYPFSVAGAFGYGWDDLETLTDQFVTTAQSQSTAQRQIYVSNEVDFFEHFSRDYAPDQLPSETVSYGNDWDTDCASIAPLTNKVRMAVDKLRTAETLASLAALADPGSYPAEDPRREQAWLALASFWEHNLGLGGCCETERGEWQKRLQEQLSRYVDSLYNSSLNRLIDRIPGAAGRLRFAVFNGLGWPRTEVADVPYNGPAGIRVLELNSGVEVPHQLVEIEGKSQLRILATNVPATGYKVYEIQTGAGTPGANAVLRNGNSFENTFYQLLVSPGGAIASLIDKSKGGREFVRRINGRLLNDFGQGDSQEGTLMLVNNGPVSATIACASNSPLRHTTFITLYRDIDRIDIDNRINDQFGDAVRTYSFSFDVSNPTVWHEELGAILRAKTTTNGGHYAFSDQPVRHEWQTLNHFADLGNDEKGVELSNAGAAFMKLGNSTREFLDENSSQINVLIGGRMAGSGPGFANQFGLTEFENRFSLRTRSRAYDPAQAMKFALEHQHPLATGLLKTTASDSCGGFPADQFSLIQIDNPEVLLWGLKPAEEGDAQGGFIARLWNMSRNEQPVALRIDAALQSAARATHLETDIEPLTVNAGNLNLIIGQQKLETFRLGLQKSFSGGALRSRVEASICSGQNYEGYSQAGTYTDTLRSRAGCDSIRVLVLKVFSKPDTTFVRRFTCKAQEAGRVVNVLVSQTKCDSVVVTTTEFRPFTFEILSQDAACSGLNDGAITIQGMENYQYRWSDGPGGPDRTGLRPGTYTVRIIDPQGNCEQTETITIGEKEQIRVNITGLDNYCFGGFVTAIVRGGQPPFRFVWNTGDTIQSISGIEAGAYQVTVTDSRGCNSRAETLIPDFDSLKVNVSRRDVSCPGGSDGRIALNIEGGVPPYRISLGGQEDIRVLENLAAGNYPLNIADSEGCNTSRVIVVRQPAPLQLNLVLRAATSGAANGSASANPSGGTRPYTLNWSNGGIGDRQERLAPGAYSVTLTDANGCTTVVPFEITSTTSYKNITTLNYFDCYPNPAADLFSLRAQFSRVEKGRLQLVSTEGKIVFQQTFHSAVLQEEIDLKGIPAGLYQVRLLVGSEEAGRPLIVQ